MSNEHYKGGRLSALSGTTDHALVEHLRTICESGDSEMFAAEEYDPNFALKLDAAPDEASASILLAEWLKRRVDVLTHTQHSLRDAWRIAKSKVGARG